MATKEILLVASGDSRQSANEMCWPAQDDMERRLSAALEAAGGQVRRAHSYKPELRHGFIASQKEGMEVFAGIDPDAPLIVAEAVWQYSHHVLAGLISHRGPILTVANWSGTWPGLVGLLNLNGSLTKAGARYASLWSEDFTDDVVPRQARALARQRRRGARHEPCPAVRGGRCAGAGARGGADARRRPAPPQGHHGRVRRGLHGHVQRHRPGRTLVPARHLQGAALASRRSTTPPPKCRDEEARAVAEWLRRFRHAFHPGGTRRPS